ncbi:MAG: trypsin-like serine protease [Vulcanimicrobiaceae bacterium]
MPFQCLPSGLNGPSSFSSQIAYAQSCAVAGSPQQALLQSMAVSLMGGNNTSGYSSYCTGIPISFNPATGVGFVVTAAHCVAGGLKAAGAQITPGNIITFINNGLDRTGIYQKTPGQVASSLDLTGQIQAVYVPSQYCMAPAFKSDGNGCTILQQQNGDVAVLKVLVTNGNTLAVSSQVQLAPSTLSIPSGAYLMALGYGLNNGPAPNSSVLYYVDYQYFANNSYQGESGEASLMNGYYTNGTYYSIICQGDSGGPDFYWDGAKWDLVGAHSYGPTPCGISGPSYSSANDVSADVRLFTSWIQTILAHDTSPTGCANVGSQYVCNAR